MAKNEIQFVCQQCGAAHSKWAGRCDACGGWNTLVEEAVATGPAKSLAKSGFAKTRGRKLDFTGLQGDSREIPRRVTGIAEFDRVCGGGMVPGSALLVGGDPGIGKSTVLLQALAALAAGQGGKTFRCAYISGEESLDQVRLRAARLGVERAPVELAASTSIRDIAASLDHAGGPDVVVIDSIQTMYLDTCALRRKS
jgi:DNA repair protein RadA/Sms